VKAINNEAKVLYKYRDVEALVIAGISHERIVSRIQNSEPMRSLGQWAQQANAAAAGKAERKKSVAGVVYKQGSKYQMPKARP